MLTYRDVEYVNQIILKSQKNRIVRNHKWLRKWKTIFNFSYKMVKPPTLFLFLIRETEWRKKKRNNYNWYRCFDWWFLNLDSNENMQPKKVTVPILIDMILLQRVFSFFFFFSFYYIYFLCFCFFLSMMVSFRLKHCFKNSLVKDTTE